MSISEALVRELAALPRVTETPLESVLQRVVTVVGRWLVPCSGTSIQLESDGGVQHIAASHSDLLEMLQQEPWPAILSSGQRVDIPETLADRSPAGRLALSYGLRSLTILPFTAGQPVIMGFYSVRPGIIADESLSALLTENISVTLRNATDHDDALADGSQMADALVSRADIDQAKGIIMSERGCDADEAFEILRSMAETDQAKITSVARRIVADRTI